MRGSTQSWLIIVLSILTLGCAKAQKTTENSVHISDKNVLIVYLSRTNNTSAVAKMIEQQISGRMEAIELLNPYPADYKTTVDQVARENASGYLPPLRTKIDSFEKYDVIFVGFPTWGMQLPPPMKSFLSQYDFSGKTVVPFNTNAGYGVGSSFETVKALCPNSTVLEGLSVKGGIERDGALFVMEGERATNVNTEVIRWLEKIKIVEAQN